MIPILRSTLSLEINGEMAEWIQTNRPNNRCTWIPVWTFKNDSFMKNQPISILHNQTGWTCQEMCSHFSPKISIATIKPQFAATNTSPISHRRQPIRVEACDPNRVVVAKHIPEDHRPDLIPRHPMRQNPIQLFLLSDFWVSGNCTFIITLHSYAWQQIWIGLTSKIDALHGQWHSVQAAALGYATVPPLRSSQCQP